MAEIGPSAPIMTNSTVRAPPDEIETKPATYPGPVDNPSRFEEGELVVNRYRVVKFLGAGGMGEVFEVYDAVSGQRLALKALAPSVLRKAEQVERLVREVRVASRVTHPNV